jgi:peptide/nickel transport system permease protein
VAERYKLWGSLVILGCFHVVILFAGFFAPYSFATQDRAMPFAPPTRLHWVDRAGRFHARPFVYALKADPESPGTYRTDYSRRYPLRAFVDGSPYRIAAVLPSELHLLGVEEPGRIFLLGSDGYGRDQLSRFLYGGQISLVAGILAAVMSVSLGTFIGTLAGFYGGSIDEALMRGTELFLGLPWLYLLFAVRAVLPLHIAEWQVFLLLVAILGLVGCARPARLIRGVALGAKERNFVLAARGFGASDMYLIRRHVLPQTGGVVLTQLALLVPTYVLAEVTLTFLGFGVGEPLASWGSLLSALEQYYVLSSYWWMFLPALLLAALFLAYYAAADAIQGRLKSVDL